MIIVKTTYGGQQAIKVEEASSKEVWTVAKASGHVRGPMLVTVSLLSPKRSWSHHAVTAWGIQRMFLSTLIP